MIIIILKIIKKLNIWIKKPWDIKDLQNRLKGINFIFFLIYNVLLVFIFLFKEMKEHEKNKISSSTYKETLFLFIFQLWKMMESIWNIFPKLSKELTKLSFQYIIEMINDNEEIWSYEQISIKLIKFINELQNEQYWNVSGNLLKNFITSTFLKQILFI